MTAAQDKKARTESEKENDPTREQEAGETIARQEGFQGAAEATPKGFVKVTLAHPLTRKADKVYLGLATDRDYGVNEEIEVPKAGAKSLISAGLVQVDPEDTQAVQSTLAEPTATSGNKPRK